MVIDVQKFKKKVSHSELPYKLEYCITLLSRQLYEANINYEGDMSDLGNEFGCALGNVIYDMGEQKINDFIYGFRQGIYTAKAINKIK